MCVCVCVCARRLRLCSGRKNVMNEKHCEVEEDGHGEKNVHKY